MARPIGLAAMPAPALTLVGGSLLSGQYQVCITYVNATTGAEGGVSNIAYKELTSTGGIRVTLPGAYTGATHVNVYLSESNGTVPMLHSTVAAATATIDLTVLPTGRAASAQRNEDLLPAGTLFYGNGRLCSFSGNTVYVGLPFRPGYYLTLSGFIPFTVPVTIAISNELGTYVVADQTYFIPGDLGDISDRVRAILPCGAVPGTAFAVPRTKQVGWFSVHGYVLADTNGGVDTSTFKNVDVTAPLIGIANVLEAGGFFRVSSCGYSMNLENKAVTTYSNWGITSASGKYGTKMDGVYQIDTADVVTATVNFGKQNFGSETKKLMPSLYLGVSSAQLMKMRIRTLTMDYTYAARNTGVGVQMQRVDPGQGLKANWFDLELSNTSGGDFTLASVSFAPMGTPRRI